MTTDEELIQEAIELCKNKLNGWLDLKEFVKTNGKLDPNFPYKSDINSWKTHLVEFKEHHSEMLPSGCFNYAGNPLYSEQCDKCQNGEMYPCREALIKANRLLGGE